MDEYLKMLEVENFYFDNDFSYLEHFHEEGYPSQEPYYED